MSIDGCMKGDGFSAGQVTQCEDVDDPEMTQMSSRFVQKNNYFECYNINVSYEVASEWLENNLSISRLALLEILRRDQF